MDIKRFSSLNRTLIGMTYTLLFLALRRTFPVLCCTLFVGFAPMKMIDGITFVMSELVGLKKKKKIPAGPQFEICLRFRVWSLGFRFSVSGL